MTIGPEPMIRIFLMSVLLGMAILEKVKGQRGEVAEERGQAPQSATLDETSSGLHPHPFT